MKVILTDLDGTLLDSKTYEFELARPALEKVQEKKIPLIFCSSKTRAELEYWRGLLENRHPFVVENGGAVYLPRHYFQSLASTPQERNGYDLFELGIPYSELTTCLRQASEECECLVRGFSDMTVEEVMESCQLPRFQAILASQREYDEPFLIEEPQKADVLLNRIEQRGKGWTKGGRFYHVTGKQDKARAAALLKELYQFDLGPTHIIALGDHLNDVPLLQMADTPIIVNSDFAHLLRMAVPAARVTESAGPLGWKEAVLAILQER